MITVILTGYDYTQEAGPLVRAFFSGQEVKVLLCDASERFQTEADTVVRIALSDDEISCRVVRRTPADGTADNAFDIPADNTAKNAFDTPADSTARIDEFEKALTGESVPKKENFDDQRVYKREYRNAFMRTLYSVLSEISGKELPWGILTGVRPVKLFSEGLGKELKDEEIFEKMSSQYLISDSRLKMALRVAKNEERLLSGFDASKGYSIYVGIPFCPSICHYCTFGSSPIDRFRDKVEGYLTALFSEIEFSAELMAGRIPDTVYIGGGTPTTLEPSDLERLINKLRSSFGFENVKEFTVEAGRPDSITFEKLRVLKDMGVTRISVNPQTMSDRTLELIGRRHTSAETVEAFELARQAGFDNINMDIIIGLTGETPKDVENTLRRIGELNPDSLTVHALSVKRAARLKTEHERYAGLEATDVMKMQELAHEFAASQGYEPYYLYRQKNMAENLENVGYARYGREGLYNVLIMEEVQTILAMGAGASTKIVFPGENRIERVENCKSVTDYISRIDEMKERKLNEVRR